MVFIHFLSVVVEKMNNQREKDNLPRKTVKLAVLLPVSTAIGSKSVIIADRKEKCDNHRRYNSNMLLSR